MRNSQAHTAEGFFVSPGFGVVYVLEREREREIATLKKMSSQLTGSHGGIELVSITANIQTLTGKYA